MSIRKLKIKIKSLAAEQSIIKMEEHKARRSDIWNWKQHKGDAVFAPSADIHSNINAATYYQCTTAYSLRDHRVNDVRPELRAANIAYGLLRGRKLEQIETIRSGKSLDSKPYRDPDWARVESMIKKFGGTTLDKLLSPNP